MIISIIIPTHKRADQVTRLLKTIAEQDFPHEDLQVLLISNLKDEKLREQIPYWKSLFFDFKYRELGCVGVNKARNMGIRFSAGDILYFLDDDCLLPNKNHLRNLVLEHERNPSVIGIGGSYKALESFYGLEKFYHEHSQKWIENFVSSGKETSQLVGGNASYKREIFDKGFYFDPLIAFGGSEEGFNRSLKGAGYTLLYSEKLWLFHVVELKLLFFIKKSFKQGLGLFKNRYKSGQTISNLQDIKKEWAFLSGEFSFYSVVYNLFFKLGYFWGLSYFIKGNFLTRFFYFIFLIFKSRLYFLKEHFVSRYIFGWLYSSVILRWFGKLWYVLGKLWYVLGWLYGSVFLRWFGKLWYVLGWLYGSVFLRWFGKLWYVLGWLYGSVFLRWFGKLWYVLGWLYGSVFLRWFGKLWYVLGKLWYVLGWLYGSVFLRWFGKLWYVLGKLWYVLGWLYGSVFLRWFGKLWYVLGKLWYVLGWLYGSVFLRWFGKLWYVLGWLYGSVFLRWFGKLWYVLGKLWYVLGWLYGSVFLRWFGKLWYVLGKLWYVLGWLYGSVFLRWFGKLWYVLGKLWYVLGWLYGSVFLRWFGKLWYVLGKLWYVLGWLYGSVFLRWFGKLWYVLGKLWYVLGWLYGSVFLRWFGKLWYVLGKLWYVLGWLYGSVFLFIFYHSPPMKAYYFTKYQYYKRIKPFLSGNKNKIE